MAYPVATYIGGGNQVPVQAPKTAAAVINAGDLIGSASNAVYSAADQVWNSSLSQTQHDFHDSFYGVALDSSLAAETRDILVQPDGRCRFPCDALGAAHHIGELVGPAQGTGNHLSSTKVAIVATANLAVGRLVKEAASGATTLEFELLGVLTTPGSGCQAKA